MSAGFDRVRPRRADAPVLPEAREVPLDAEGKRALFSAGDGGPAAAYGSVVVHCSACGTHTPVPLTRAARLAVPSLHLPLLRRRFPSWMRCPACRRRTWVRLSLQL